MKMQQAKTRTEVILVVVVICTYVYECVCVCVCVCASCKYTHRCACVCIYVQFSVCVTEKGKYACMYMYADPGRLNCVNQTQLICCQSDSKLKFIHIEKMNFLGAFVCLSQCVYMRECNTMAQNTICLAHYVLVWKFDLAPRANNIWYLICGQKVLLSFFQQCICMHACVFGVQIYTSLCMCVYVCTCVCVCACVCCFVL